MIGIEVDRLSEDEMGGEGVVEQDDRVSPALDVSYSPA